MQSRDTRPFPHMRKRQRDGGSDDDDDDDGAALLHTDYHVSPRQCRYATSSACCTDVHDIDEDDTDDVPLLVHDTAHPDWPCRLRGAAAKATRALQLHANVSGRAQMQRNDEDANSCDTKTTIRHDTAEARARVVAHTRAVLIDLLCGHTGRRLRFYFHPSVTYAWHALGQHTTTERDGVTCAASAARQRVCCSGAAHVCAAGADHSSGAHCQVTHETVYAVHEQVRGAVVHVSNNATCLCPPTLQTSPRLPQQMHATQYARHAYAACNSPTTSSCEDNGGDKRDVSRDAAPTTMTACDYYYELAHTSHITATVPPRLCACARCLVHDMNDHVVAMLTECLLRCCAEQAMLTRGNAYAFLYQGQHLRTAAAQRRLCADVLNNCLLSSCCMGNQPCQGTDCTKDHNTIMCVDGDGHDSFTDAAQPLTLCVWRTC